MPDLTNENEEAIEVEQTEEKPTRSDNRFRDLSEKVKTTSEERDAAKAQAEAAAKEVEFYKGFNKVASKYDGANEYQDKILEKVNSGYDLEDATVAVLNKAGRLNQQTQSQPRQSPAGGSASTAIRSEEKLVSDMTTAEKKAALQEIERTDPGSLAQSLRTLNL